MASVRDVYNTALALMAENPQDATDYEEQVVPLVNLMLWELHDINNILREWAGLKPLGSPQTVKTMDDILYLEAELTIGTLPYGLAAKLILDDDANKAAYFNEEYMEKKERNTKAVWID